MRRQRNAKIIATLGPGTDSREAIAALFKAGVDVFRLNFSHGTHQEHAERLTYIRELEERFGHPTCALMDLQGPKLRVGTFEKGRVVLEPGARFRFDLDARPGDENRASLPHPEIFAALRPGHDLMLDDGKIRLHVEDCGPDHAVTKVVIGGPLSDHKGVNVPSAILELSPITAKDREDLRFGLDLGFDWVALSFVQRPEDVAEARRLISGRAAILSKIEKPSAIEHMQEIVELSDAVMVARGDLGVEVPPEKVPSIQKRIVHACRVLGKPVVVATQMLDSMVDSPTPTRAEASDVANAVFDGVDAVMLSAETAVGRYPIEAVAMMDRIIRQVESDPLYRKLMETERRDPQATAEDAITAAARQVAHIVAAAAIVTFSSTGATTLRAARERPEVPILGLTPNERTARKVMLAWGVHSVLVPDLTRFSEMVHKAVVMAQREEFASPGQRLVITAGVPFGTPGATNILRIAWVEDDY